MAKRKSGVNVSEAIRNYLKDHADVGPKAAADELTKQLGKKISPTYVSNIKSLSKAKVKTGKRGNKPGPKAKVERGHAETNGLVAVDTLLSLKALVREVGAEKAKTLIDLLA